MKKWIKEKMKVEGCRNSRVRNQIISAIDSSCKMFQAQDIIDALPSVDRVTIYRNLELLSSIDIIHSTGQFNGAQFYELHSPSHHHHAICKECSVQECVVCEVPETPGKHHTIFYSFVCTQCA